MSPDIDLIVIGASLGGFDAIPTVISAMPRATVPAILIVQHRASGQESLLANLLGERCGREIVEPNHGDSITAGAVYLAPADYHILVEPGRFALSTEGPVNFARPSIDVALESAADSYRDRVAAVVLTGSSNDGAQGARSVADVGGSVLIQDPNEALSPVSPAAAAKLVMAAQLWRLEDLGKQLAALCAVKPGSGR